MSETKSVNLKTNLFDLIELKIDFLKPSIIIPIIMTISQITGSAEIMHVSLF